MATKQQTTWIPAMRDVIENEDLTFLNKKEIWFLTNKRLPKEDKIAWDTFDNWSKGRAINMNDEIGRTIQDMLLEADIRMKQSIGKKMLDKSTERSWQKMAWLLERKYKEFNNKVIQLPQHAPQIFIDARNSKDEDMINNILNGGLLKDAKPIAQLKENNNENDNDNDS
ncbi:hypothetical protein [Galbibacter pacificus]|uniref:Uncharacterized protein n=1 Tax=Galbibacter pacificus TaxID=2996052 RepID=A0ABT6FR74_9FLAO|nr:hypothetical protein [Galbibacter pacificus]MDG3581762.1 hypothetical protein [Galbibacter pacificus]MDG3585764.1 hypothetical protein [Galbibacter pacificus]